MEVAAASGDQHEMLPLNTADGIQVVSALRSTMISMQIVQFRFQHGRNIEIPFAFNVLQMYSTVHMAYGQCGRLMVRQQRRA